MCEKTTTNAPIKTCKTCSIEKSENDFYEHPKTGFFSSCKACVKSRANERYAEYRARYKREKTPPTSKVCKECQCRKAISEFYDVKVNGKTYKNSYCIPCKKKYDYAVRKLSRPH